MSLFENVVDFETLVPCPYLHFFGHPIPQCFEIMYVVDATQMKLKWTGDNSTPYIPKGSGWKMLWSGTISVETLFVPKPENTTDKAVLFPTVI